MSGDRPVAPLTGAPTHGAVGLDPARRRRTLAAAFLGWTFDGYETYALVLAIGPALAELAPDAGADHARFLAGLAIGLTLLAWGVGGSVGGVLADYVGRKPVMVGSVLAYAVLSGLTALSTTFAMLLVFRVLTGLAMGQEWSTGTSLVHEVFPETSRTKAIAFLQSGFGFGALLASLVWFLVTRVDPDGWRWMFVVGALPALLVLWIRRDVPESARWQRSVAAERAASGGARRFTLTTVLADPEPRRRLLLAFGLSLVTIVGWYGISSFLPQFAEERALDAGLDAQGFVQWTTTSYTVGSIVGYLGSAWVADRFGRRPLVLAFLLGSYATTWLLYAVPAPPVLFVALAAVNGLFTLGGFVWLALYLPELFGSAVRSSASGLVFNGTRLVAWVGPLVSGGLVATFGGPATTALAIGTVYLLGLALVPRLVETRGLPLPD